MMTPESASQFFDQRFASAPVMVILRGETVERTLALARRAVDAGITTIEVPLQSDESERALERAVTALSPLGAVVGSGTITTPELAERAHNAGAAFTVAPGLDLETCARSLGLGMPHLPGVATSTEIQLAMKLGMRWLKAFPAAVLGASWITAMAGPFPQARFVATGGIDGTNAHAFLDAGAGAVSLGSSFARMDPRELEKLSRGSDAETKKPRNR